MRIMNDTSFFFGGMLDDNYTQITRKNQQIRIIGKEGDIQTHIHPPVKTPKKWKKAEEYQDVVGWKGGMRK